MAPLHKIPVFFALAVSVCFNTGAAAAGKLNIVHSFCDTKSCGYGDGPSGLVQDSAGNLYGTTQGVGGVAHTQAIYELFNGRNYKLLYAFCPRRDCSTGNIPNGPLVIDTSGSLYGVAQEGGSQNKGTIFELSPNADRSQWSITVLYSFCSEANCKDGDDPTGGLTYAGAQSGLPYDGVSPLYGTTRDGGAGQGVTFQFTPGEQGWTETVIHAFCQDGGKCADGATPGGLLFDSGGNIFGTAAQGGASGGGVVYRLDAGTWAETVLYDFCSQKKCSDGQFPFGLVQDASGAFIGVTGAGGRGCRIASRQGDTCGLVYKLTSNADAWQETVLHTFCSLKDCRDGAFPESTLLLDSAGNLFGTTFAGGGNDVDQNGEGGGVAFELSGATFTELHKFCSQGGSACTDGMYPSGNLVMDGAGHVFGTTQLGGEFNGGEVFRLTP